ncbi:MAG: SulP family inorganic anion transporter [Parachlamydiales bacterium]|jgi:SulP family sulfate permease
MRRSLIPKLYSLFKEEKYSFSIFQKDLFAGIVVGILSIPMSLAFAIASGARPEQGLFTAVISGFIVGIFGGNRVQIAGPTGAFVLIILVTINQYGYEGLAVATLLAGIFLIIMAISRAGSLIKYIPYPVVIGFTSGLALIIFINQIPDFLGIQIENLPKELLPRTALILSNLSSLNVYSLLIGMSSIFIVILWPKFVKNIPGSLIAIITTTILAFFLYIPVDVIKDRFGEIQKIIPSFQFPKISWQLITQMIPSSIAIALLAGMEALLSSIVADGMLSRRHRSDAELFAQGLGNVFSVFFQGIPATGTIARTATCIKTGGQTPIAAIVNVITIITVLLCIGKYVSYIPMAALAAVIMVVAYNMSEWRVFAKLFLSPKKDIAVMLATFFLTVFVDLITAIEVGIILAMFLFISNVAKHSKTNSIKDIVNNPIDEKNKETILETIPQEIEVFELSGPLFFAAAEEFKIALTRINRIPKILILRLRFVNYIDATALRALEDILIKCKKDKTLFVLSGVNIEVKKVLEKTNFINKIGKENVYANFDDALKECLKLIPDKTAKEPFVEASEINKE